MTSISVQDLLDEVETLIAEEYPDDPQAVEDGVTVAEDFLYGTFGIAGVAESSIVTVDDYTRFGESICNDDATTEFYYGSAADEDLFFEVRDILDEILQDEFQGSNTSIYTRWGECPSEITNQNVTATPYFFGNTTLSSDVFGSANHQITPTEVKSKSVKKPKSTASVTQYATTAAAPVSASAAQSTLENATSSAPKRAPALTGRAYCDALAKEIQPGGANLIMVGAGFACEYNYDPNRRDPIVEIGFHGENLTSSVYKYYPKTPATPKPATPAVGVSPVQNSSPVTASTSTAPTPKPKSLDDLFKLYQGGASEKDIERLFQYRGDVPSDVDDPDGINAD